MSKSPEELFKERCQRLIDVRNLKEPDYTPFYLVTEEWSVYYHGKYKVGEIHYDYTKCGEVAEHLVRTIPQDAWGGPQWIWPGPMLDALGSKSYKIPGRDLDPNLQEQFPQDKEYMTPEEYPEFIEDPFAFMIEKGIPRRHFELEKSPRKEIALAKGALEFNKWWSYVGSLVVKFIQEYGIPPIVQGLAASSPLGVIEDHFRTFPGICLDIKRRPEEVKAACDALVPVLVKMAELVYEAPTPFPYIFIPLHIGQFLSPKDFEEIYWPSFKKLAETLIKDGYTPHYYAEAKWTPYIEFLAELPKGSVWIFEEVDFEKVDKLCDNLCFGGTLTTDLLRYGTKEKVISEAKAQMEKFGPRGGFILTVNKDMMDPNDGKPENVVALAKFINEEYRR